MKIGSKLIISFVIVAIIAGFVGVIGITNIKTMRENDEILYTNMTVPLSQAVEMAKLFQRARVNTRDMILENNTDDINAKYEEIEEIVVELNKNADEFNKSLITDAGRTAFDEFMAARVDYRSYLDELLQLCLANKDANAYDLLQGDMKAASDKEQASIDKLVDLKVENAKIRADENSDTAASATLTMLVVIAGGMLIAILLGLFISRIIGVPIRKVSKVAELIAEGDLNISLDINTKDEVGNLATSFRKMAENLNEVMTNMSIAAEQVASGSKQVSDSSMALSQGATEQASSVEELTASLEEIAVQTKLNADSANEANQLAEIAKENAAQGNAQMKEMLKAMDEINDSSSNISKIIKVIDEIAFQTNILALNAAVEAARAGQHGKGFAVVAEEVRNLAARSANAAKETTEMIEGSIKKVDGGTKIANQTADALSKIVDNIAKVSNIVGNIAVASNEQASGIAQVNQGIIQVSDVVQTNSATSEESAAASEELSSQAELLRNQVSRFKLKKAEYNRYSYNDMDRANPDVIKMLEHMGDKKKYTQTNHSVIKSSQGPQKIILSDKEFGKY
jgi:methyl-accepting chemotaxis protein